MKSRMWVRALALMALAVAVAPDARASGVEDATSCPIVASTDFAIYGQTAEGGVAASSRRWMGAPVASATSNLVPTPSVEDTSTGWVKREVSSAKGAPKPTRTPKP